ncbi:hypothetical protein G5B31_17285 [Rhodobacter sp. SGA-6-6]|uniref:anti-sigma factor n=1 Tax=Rhodobacter sp. SGA-6-6 TaxID=2710882 RepID=UPI0013EDEEC3|nr:anti-sigma factor [Rhodobacter sp. SGA-6-6]NGM47294.1 hypothetical protein [Rhodobacter sp. SGA-6-6]
MTDASLTLRETDEVLAAEYVLGVLDREERAAVAARLRQDQEFAGLVAAWEERLSGLNGGFAEAPAADLLPRIEARLFPAARSPRRWSPLRWLAGAGVAAALVLAGLAMLPPPRSDLVAVLAAADNRLAYEVRRSGQTLRITRVAGEPAAEGQVHELWVIAPGAAPVSLGLLQQDALVVDHALPAPGWVLAVSVEPAGGSPSGQPTGPVILTAQVEAGT